MKYPIQSSAVGTEAPTTPGAPTTQETITTQAVTTQGVTARPVTTQQVVTTQQGVTTQQMVVTSSVPDTLAPVISNCPDDITVVAPVGETTVAVFWDPPTAVDDSGIYPAIFASSNPGDVFRRGDMEVIYLFLDGTFNRATCRFIVTVTIGKDTVNFVRYLISQRTLDSRN